MARAAGGVVDAAVGGHGRARCLGQSKPPSGPASIPCCYEFSEVDLAGLVAAFGPEVRGRTTGGRPALDLPTAVGAALAEAGVTMAAQVDRLHGLRRRATSPTGQRAERERQAMMVWRGADGRSGGDGADPTAEQASPTGWSELRRRIASAAPDPAAVDGGGRDQRIRPRTRFGPPSPPASPTIGENYAAELVAKAAALRADRTDGQPVWHFLGAVQRNKVARLAPLVSLLAVGGRLVEEGGHRPAPPRRRPCWSRWT